MNKLIQKAIQAIQDGKNEYAVGLLEGLLELSGKPLDFSTVSTRTGTDGVAIAHFDNPRKAASAKESEGDIALSLERAVGAKLEAIKGTLQA